MSDEKIRQEPLLWTGDHYNEGIGRDDIFDKLREECGVFGVFNLPEASTFLIMDFMRFSIVVRKAREYVRWIRRTAISSPIIAAWVS